MDVYKGALNGSPDDLNIILRVIGKRRESSDCISVLFVRPQGLSFNAGDWLDIRFLDPDLAVGRTFSFASAPTESDLQVTFRIGRSPFKRRLETVTAGEMLLITQYGSNGFLLDRSSPAVFLAGGVGIAPFRSMIKDAVDHGDNVPITLIHVNRREDAPFRGELLGWRDQYGELVVHHVASAAKGRLTIERLRALIAPLGEAPRVFYVAGPPSFVTSSTELLAGIEPEPIEVKRDSFTGY